MKDSDNSALKKAVLHFRSKRSFEMSLFATGRCLTMELKGFRLDYWERTTSRLISGLVDLNRNP